MNLKLVKDTAGLIQEQLSKCERPAVSWSGGKDSQVLLFLVRQFAPGIPVLYFKGLPHPTKHGFVLRMAVELGLNLIIPRPRFKDLIAKDGRVELIEIYEVAPRKLLYFPIEGEQGMGSECSVDMLLSHEEPTEMNFDGIFIGHRGDDVDPTHGEVPLKERVVEADGFRYVYPLKDWTERDIWEFSGDLLIPQNVERYAGDMSANNDYHNLCTNCLSSSGTVYCPKAMKDAPGLGSDLGLEERREMYSKALSNIERRM